jgi:hypothetical protein
MRRLLSIILKIAGLALGLGVVGVLIALEWPDAASSADHAMLGRHILDVVWLDLLIGLAFAFPFLWIGDRISPDGSDTNVHAAMPE